MAYTSTNHQFRPAVRVEPINPKYETRKYITGGFFLFFGSVQTEYKNEMVSCDGYKEIWYCAKCGENEEHKNHNLLVKADSFN